MLQEQKQFNKVVTLSYNLCSVTYVCMPTNNLTFGKIGDLFNESFSFSANNLE